MKKNRERGSLTLEAAIILPIFLIMILFTNSFFIDFTSSQIVEHALIQSTKSLAFDPYSSGRTTADQQDKLADMFMDIFSIGAGNHTSNEAWYDKNSGVSIEKTVKDRFLAYLKETPGEADDLLRTIGIKDGKDGLDFSGTSVDDSGMLTVKLRFTHEHFFNIIENFSGNREISLKIKLFKSY